MKTDIIDLELTKDFSQSGFGKQGELDTTVRTANMSIKCKESEVELPLFPS